MPKILTKIKLLDDNALARLLANAHALLEKSAGNGDAILVIDAVQDE